MGHITIKGKPNTRQKTRHFEIIKRMERLERPIQPRYYTARGPRGGEYLMVLNVYCDGTLQWTLGRFPNGNDEKISVDLVDIVE